ncbi:hypothetical protein ACFFJY_06225 [Fictibacillus aquaticus]|uniref:Uncharacterized protein n=1 Tax=Fictibacillus aquaticus TaxID=2021314 RepID=A0A235FA81_9BACL|nr:hypothetical protein [Fictibacillus aquaticus]OYD58198.1 hypothetical protein CGZ90_09975 [Fictibacillus aquaticus]
MNDFFREDERLGIKLPFLKLEWHQYSSEVQEAILLEWENIRGIIPDRIKEIENQINMLQTRLDHEENFPISCELNTSIAHHASVINDLWLWYRHNGAAVYKSHT